MTSGYLLLALLFPCPVFFHQGQLLEGQNVLCMWEGWGVRRCLGGRIHLETVERHGGVPHLAVLAL